MSMGDSVVSDFNLGSYITKDIKIFCFFVLSYKHR